MPFWTDGKQRDILIIGQRYSAEIQFCTLGPLTGTDTYLAN
ncbi:hypothetical protein V1283_005328 [Bradyrhizobium sp. AZCC 2262]